jgi:hypothetical protein
MSFPLPLDAINDSEKWSFHFFLPQTVGTPVSYKATTSLQFPPFSSILIIASFCVNVMFPFANHTFIPHVNLLKPLNSKGLSRVQRSQDKVAESDYTPEVTDSRTYSFETTFHKCQTIMSARLSGAGLKQFYHITTASI